MIPARYTAVSSIIPYSTACSTKSFKCSVEYASVSLTVSGSEANVTIALQHKFSYGKQVSNPAQLFVTGDSIPGSTRNFVSSGGALCWFMGYFSRRLKDSVPGGYCLIGYMEFFSQLRLLPPLLFPKRENELSKLLIFHKGRLFLGWVHCIINQQSSH